MIDFTGDQLEYLNDIIRRELDYWGSSEAEESEEADDVDFHQEMMGLIKEKMVNEVEVRAKLEVKFTEEE